SANHFALDQRDAQSAIGKCAGAVLAWRAGADDNDVIAVAHDGTPCRPVPERCTRCTSRASSHPPARSTSHARRAWPRHRCSTPTSSLCYRAGALGGAINDTVFHHEIHLGGGSDVGDGIAG